MRQPPRRNAPGQGDAEIVGPIVLTVIALAVAAFWPVAVWHGYTDTGGWRWDIHSTAAELTWFGIIGFIALLYRADHRPGRAAAPPKPKRERAWPPPKYVPPRPGPDPAVTMRLLEGLDEIDRYAAEAEKARTGEELDYLDVYGRLPGREKRRPR